MRRRPLVLQVGPLPPPLGGVAIALQGILACPPLAAVEQRVVNISRSKPTEVVGRKGLTAERLLRRCQLLVRIGRAILNERPDLVHLHLSGWSALDLIGEVLMMWVAWLAGVPVIAHLHTDPAHASLPGVRPAGRWLFRWLFRPARSLFVLSDGYRESLLASGLNRPIFVVPNMCDETLVQIDEGQRSADSAVRVVYLGRLSRDKGFFDLLQVAAQLRTSHPGIRFEVAGLPSTSDEECTIQTVIGRDGLGDTVTLLGTVNGEAKRALFARADVVVCPSYYESFGIVALEAMAAGLPVVAAHVGGLASLVIEGHTGFLVKPGDVKTLAQRLVTLAESPATRQQMGRSGRERFLQQYRADTIGGVILQGYRATLTSRAFSAERIPTP